MKITARVTLGDDECRENLVQAFFNEEDFSPKNKLRIVDDKTAFIQLEFDNNPPQSIIKAISHCQIDIMDNLETSSIEALIGKDEPSETPGDLVEAAVQKDAVGDDEDQKAVQNLVAEDEPISEMKNPPETVDVETDSKLDDETTTVPTISHGEPKKVKKRRFGKQKPSEDDYLDIPDFDALVAKVSSITEFVTEVGKWLELPEEDNSYFVRLVAELSTLDVEPYEISNDNVKNANLSISHHDYRRYKFGKQVSALLEKHNIYATILPFLCTIIKYAKQIDCKDASTLDGDAKNDEGDSHAAEDTGTIEVVPEAEDPLVNEPEKPADELEYLKCEAFVQILQSLDKEAPAEERVKVLLSKMGLERESKLLYNNACQLVQAAFSMESLDSIDDVLLQAGIDTKTKSGMTTKIKLSEWINQYNKDNHVKRMKVVAFLRELKAIFTQ